MAGTAIAFASLVRAGARSGHALSTLAAVPSDVRGVFSLGRLRLFSCANGQKTETTGDQSQIGSWHEEQEVVATASVRDRIGEPGASPEE